MRSIGMVLLLPALAALVAGVVLWAGWVDLSAVAAPTRLEEGLARLALDRSIARRAPRRGNPFAGSAEDAHAGLLLFRSECVTCHGAPGVDPSAAGAS